MNTYADFQKNSGSTQQTLSAHSSESADTYKTSSGATQPPYFVRFLNGNDIVDIHTCNTVTDACNMAIGWHTQAVSDMAVVCRYENAGAQYYTPFLWIFHKGHGRLCLKTSDAEYQPVRDCIIRHYGTAPHIKNSMAVFFNPKFLEKSRC